MSNWWEDFWNGLFTQELNQPARNPVGNLNKGYIDASAVPLMSGQGVYADQLRRSSASQAAAKPAPNAAPSASPSSTQPVQAGANESENAVTKALKQINAQQPDTGNPLYGNIPNANVYMGKSLQGSRVGKPTEPGKDNLSGLGSSGYFMGDKYESLQEVIASVNDWGTAEIARFNKLAIGAGLLKAPTTNLDEISNIWSQIAARTAMMNERGKKITPWQLLGRYSAGSSSLPGQGPKTTTATNTSVQHLDTGTSKALLNDALAKALGRAPTKDERARFMAALKAQENKNPSKTTTTTTTNGRGASSSSSTSSGGMTSSGYGQFADDWAMSHNKGEAQSYQAATTYMNYLFEGLAAPV